MPCAPPTSGAGVCTAAATVRAETPVLCTAMLFYTSEC
eukprot:COSAG06_NODE_26627_length_610_cov_1.373777_1_plen_37_part_10